MSGPAIGLVSPGAMGAAVGRVLTGAGATVRWASEGRSGPSVRRAAEAGLRDVGSLAELVAASDVMLSIVPPHAALETARATAAHGFGGLYVDANAIAPMTAGEVAAIVRDAGADYVDGGIVGLPPGAAGTTRLYLSGTRAEEVATLFGGTILGAPVLEGEYSASALKMVYAAWAKGVSALVLAVHGTAEALGVAEELEHEWALSRPRMAERLAHAREVAAEKGWRWVAEMEEIAATFRSGGWPPGFHEAAADVFRRTSDSG